MHSADTEQKLKRYMLIVDECLGKAGKQPHPSHVKQCKKVKVHDNVGMIILCIVIT